MFTLFAGILYSTMTTTTTMTSIRCSTPFISVWLPSFSSQPFATAFWIDLTMQHCLFAVRLPSWLYSTQFSKYNVVLFFTFPSAQFTLCDRKHISSKPILFASKILFIGCGLTCAYITAAWLLSNQCGFTGKRLEATIKMFKHRIFQVCNYTQIQWVVTVCVCVLNA